MTREERIDQIQRIGIVTSLLNANFANKSWNKATADYVNNGVKLRGATQKDVDEVQSIHPDLKIVSYGAK